MLYIVLNILLALALITAITWVIVKVATAAANHPQTTAKALVALVGMMVLFGCYMTANATEALPEIEIIEPGEVVEVGIFNDEGVDKVQLWFWHRDIYMNLNWEIDKYELVDLSRPIWAVCYDGFVGDYGYVEVE